MTEERKIAAGTVVPLMIGGLIVAAVGFYAALNSGSDTPEHAKLPSQASIHALPEGLDVTASPVSLALKSTPNTLRLKLSQTSARAVDGKPVLLETRIDLQLRDEPFDTKNGGLGFNRTYSDVTVAVIEDGKPMLGDIPPQVAALLQTATHQMRLDPSGEVLEFKMTSSPSAQMRQMVGILEDATLMVIPRFPREPVNIGEAWTFSAPYRIGGQEQGIGLSGEYTMSNTYRGTIERDGHTLAVIEHTINGQGAGSWVQPDGSKSAITANGVGQGMFYIDVDTGAVARVELLFEQVTSGGAGVGIQTTTRVELGRVPST